MSSRAVRLLSPAVGIGGSLDDVASHHVAERRAAILRKLHTILDEQLTGHLVDSFSVSTNIERFALDVELSFVRIAQLGPRPPVK